MADGLAKREYGTVARDGLWHWRNLDLDVHQLLSSCVSLKKVLSLSEPLSSLVKMKAAERMK